MASLSNFVSSFRVLALMVVMTALASCSDEPDAAVVAADPSHSTPVAREVTPTALDHALDEWIALGGAIDGETMERRARVSGPNAADVYRPAFDSIESLADEDLDILTGLEDVHAMEDVLSYIPTALDRLHEGSRMAQVNWDIRYTDGVFVRMGHLARCRAAAKALRAEAAVCAASEDLDGAIDAIITGLRLGEHSDEGGATIGLLVGVSIQSLMLDALEVEFRDARTPEADALQSLLSSDSFDERVRQAFLIEGGAGLATFWQDASRWANAEYSAFSPKDSPYRRVSENARRPERGVALDPEIESEILAYLDLHMEYLDWFIRPRFERERSASPRPSASDELASYVASVANQLERVVDSARSHRAVARLALDLREYRAEHGAYPDPSTFEAPIDPWTGRPISYRLDGDGFVLSSPAQISGDPIEWRWN